MGGNGTQKVVRLPVRIGVAIALLVGLHAGAAMADDATWDSGTRNNDATLPFIAWRGKTPLKVISGWIDWKNGWTGMVNYASGRKSTYA